MTNFEDKNNNYEDKNNLLKLDLQGWGMSNAAIVKVTVGLDDQGI